MNENAFLHCSILSMRRIPNNLRERAIGVGGGNVLFNDTFNTFYLRLYGVGHMAKDHSYSERGNRLPPHVARQDFERQEAPTWHVVDVRALQRVVKTSISWTRIYAIDSKLPLLLLLTHLCFILTESVRTLTRLQVNGLHARRPYVRCILTQIGKSAVVSVEKCI